MPLAIVALVLIGAAIVVLESRSRTADPGQPAPGKTQGAPPVTVVTAGDARQATAGALPAQSAPLSFAGSKPAKIDSTPELVKGIAGSLPGLATGIGTAVTTYQRQENAQSLELAKLEAAKQKQQTNSFNTNQTGLAKESGSVLRAPAGAAEGTNMFAASSGMVLEDFPAFVPEPKNYGPSVAEAALIPDGVTYRPSDDSYNVSELLDS